MDYYSALNGNDYTKNIAPTTEKPSGFFASLPGKIKEKIGSIANTISDMRLVDPVMAKMKRQAYKDSQFNAVDKISQQKAARIFNSNVEFNNMTQGSKDRFVNSPSYKDLVSGMNLGHFFTKAQEGDENSKEMLQRAVEAFNGKFIDDNGRFFVEKDGTRYDLDEKNIKAFQENIFDSALKALNTIKVTDFNSTGGNPEMNNMAKYTRLFATNGIGWIDAPKYTKDIYNSLSPNERNVMALRKAADIILSDGWSAEDKAEAERYGMDTILKEYHMTLSPDGRITDPDRKFGQSSYSAQEFSDILHRIDTGTEKFEGALADLKQANQARLAAETAKMLTDKSRNERLQAETLGIKARTAHTEAETAKLNDSLARKIMMSKDLSQIENIQADTDLKKAYLEKQNNPSTLAKDESQNEPRDELTSLNDKSRLKAVLLSDNKQEKLRSLIRKMDVVANSIGVSVDKDGNVVKGNRKQMETLKEFWDTRIKDIDSNISFPMNDAYEAIAKSDMGKEAQELAFGKSHEMMQANREEMARLEKEKKEISSKYIDVYGDGRSVLPVYKPAYKALKRLHEINNKLKRLKKENKQLTAKFKEAYEASKKEVR